jgi:hypothetical protein
MRPPRKGSSTCGATNPARKVLVGNCARDSEAGHLSSAARGSATSTTPLPITWRAPQLSTPGEMDRRAARHLARPPQTLSPIFFLFFFCPNLAEVASNSRYRRIGRNSPFARTGRLESTWTGCWSATSRRAPPDRRRPSVTGRCVEEFELAPGMLAPFRPCAGDVADRQVGTRRAHSGGAVDRMVWFVT